MNEPLKTDYTNPVLASVTEKVMEETVALAYRIIEALVVGDPLFQPNPYDPASQFTQGMTVGINLIFDMFEKAFETEEEKYRNSEDS